MGLSGQKIEGIGKDALLLKPCGGFCNLEADQGKRHAHERKHHMTSCMGWAWQGGMRWLKASSKALPPRREEGKGTPSGEEAYLSR